MIIILSITSVLLLAYCSLLLYYRAGWNKLKETVVPQDFKPQTSISILVPARNEEEYLPALLDSIRSQNYPADLFEVAVLDDFSDDKTGIIADGYRDNFFTVRLAEQLDGKINSYKKKAIELGVHCTKGELIVTTDADCVMGNNWLRSIAWEYEEKRSSMIVMPVKMAITDPSFLSVFQSLDFMSLQGVTGATAGHQKYLMCNGANLAYGRKAFEMLNGFRGIDDIASGDDMMLLHKLTAANHRVSYLKSPEVVVSTAPMLTIRDFFNQRIRWASKAGRYDNKTILPVLMIIYFLNLLLLVIPVAAIFSNFSTILTLIAWLSFISIKTVCELIFLWPVAGFFRERKILSWFLFSQPFHITYTVIAGLFGSFGKYKWKGRTVK